MEYTNEIEHLREENNNLRNKNLKLENEINDIRYKFCAFLTEVLRLENTGS